VSRLAVRVIGEKVESGYASQIEVGTFFEQIAHRARRLGIQVKLHRSDPVRPVANDGRGDRWPAERLTDQIGAELTSVQRAVRKVPQRPLAFARFVDGPARFVFEAQVYGERVIRAPAEILTVENLAMFEQEMGRGK